MNITLEIKTDIKTVRNKFKTLFQTFRIIVLQIISRVGVRRIDGEVAALAGDRCDH